jgi:hypothetical protein
MSPNRATNTPVAGNEHRARLSIGRRTASASLEEDRASLSHSRDRHYWIADDLYRCAIPRISEILGRRLLRQQRNAILLLLCEDPNPAHVVERGSISRAKRRARDDPLRALPYLPLLWMVLPPQALGGLVPFHFRSKSGPTTGLPTVWTQFVNVGRHTRCLRVFRLIQSTYLESVSW